MKKLFLALAVLVMSCAAASAQQKFGYINSQELVAIMPDAIKADSNLKAYLKSFQDQMEAMAKEFDRKKAEFDALPPNTSEAVREAKGRELADLQKRFQEYQQSAEEKVGKKRSDLMSPVLQRAEKAINDVAAANNYDYIFDQSGGSLLYAKPADNIMTLVKAKLGIK